MPAEKKVVEESWPGSGCVVGLEERTRVGDEVVPPCWVLSVDAVVVVVAAGMVDWLLESWVGALSVIVASVEGAEWVVVVG